MYFGNKVLAFYDSKFVGYTNLPVWRVTPPPFWYAVFRGGLGRTQYAKGRYAIRNNSVKSYAALSNSHFFKSFSVITDENITQRLKTRDWQINNVNRSQWYD